MVKNVSPKNAN